MCLLFATSMLLGIMKYFNCVKEHGHSLGVNQGIKKKCLFPRIDKRSIGANTFIYHGQSHNIIHISQYFKRSRFNALLSISLSNIDLQDSNYCIV